MERRDRARPQRVSLRGGILGARLFPLPVLQIADGDHFRVEPLDPLLERSDVLGLGQRNALAWPAYHDLGLHLPPSLQRNGTVEQGEREASRRVWVSRRKGTSRALPRLGWRGIAPGSRARWRSRRRRSRNRLHRKQMSLPPRAPQHRRALPTDSSPATKQFVHSERCCGRPHGRPGDAQ